MGDAMDIETPEPRGTKRTADDAELARNEQRRIRVCTYVVATWRIRC